MSSAHLTCPARVLLPAGLTPAAHRATSSHARALNPVVEPCLNTHLQAALTQITQLFPPAAACLAAAADAAAAEAGHTTSVLQPQQGRLSAAIAASKGRGIAGKAGSSSSSSSKLGLPSGGASSALFCMARPRMLLAGPAGSGQQQLGAAVLAALEGLPVHAIGLPSLLASAGSRFDCCFCCCCYHACCCHVQWRAAAVDATSWHENCW
jgi:hypothetical protein